ncbi:mannose-1-phosphate guanyltransferase [Prosthecochloris sp. HL-130-GSB]|uniref:Mannose-1-phosphate guanyltransferase n=2 Tax=Prosthecochloris TaxID=1101 RepID=A0A831WUY0_PROAE|nr:mannose-1-phosphate guanyltransferase [Prosthecochloris sp. HL-130-GSB]MBO8092974.1 mannose-1-phosphate guanyltransferase [Prosthecochloris sp.]HED31211.1 mannose-1-phosphate guanyltransferase [Prosthecochloris aestuarii]
MNHKDDHAYAIVMAGGTGSCLWPLSRKKHPCYFVPVFGISTMIASTLERLAGIVREDHVYVVTTHTGALLLREQMPDLPSSRVIVEPQVRGTAACISLATAVIRKRDPDALTFVVPADHRVQDTEEFAAAMTAAADIARYERKLVTVGIRPERPEPDYGYIQVELPVMQCLLPDGRSTSFFTVKTFAEKPDRKTAEEFIQCGDFYWNSGIFVWHIDVFSRELETYMPDLYRDMLDVSRALGTTAGNDVIEDVYSWIHPVSVDSGVMEKSAEVVMIEGKFGWRDLGCWDDFPDMEKMSCPLNVIGIDARGNSVHKPEGKAVCLVGVDDLIVIDTGDALLVCRKGASRSVRKAVDIMRREGLEEYL